MMTKSPSKIWWIRAAMMSLATLCLMRAVSVQAQTNLEEDYEEVYESRDTVKAEDSDQRSNLEIATRDVRFTRPEEAEARRYIEPGELAYEQVTNSERLAALRVNQSPTIQVAGASQPARKPASVPEITPQAVQRPSVSSQKLLPAQSPIPVREEFAASEAARTPVAVQKDESWKTPGSLVSAERVRGVQEVSIIVSDHGYFPKHIFVTEGVPVRMYLSTPSKSTLCMMIDSFGVKKGVSPGAVEEVSFVPDQAGEFRFYCPVKSIEGRVTVRAAADAAPVAVVTRPRAPASK